MSATCFYASGGSASTDGQTYIPCNTTAVEQGGHSACCASGDMCFTNGLCKAGEGQWNWNWRVACTDPTFQDPSCPNYCRGIESDDQAHLVFQCSDNDTWCCATGNVDRFARNYNFTCCENPELTMELGPAVFYGTAMAQVAISTLGVFSSQTTTSLIPKPSASSNVSQVTALTTMNATGYYSTETPVPTQDTTTTPAATSSASRTSPSSKALQIGLGVGISLGLAAIALVAYMFFRLGQRRSQPSGLDHQMMQNDDAKTSMPLPTHLHWLQYGGVPAAVGHEMDGQNPMAEMAHSVPVELEDRAIMESHNTGVHHYRSESEYSSFYFPISLASK
ncbi:hypothetical protein PFICI_14523 [Pestalotiopsis fici W106-1]|uniref:Mid2 domain-containing protein n=1 Tax=Pestalotiopsis fici (strain W106-1 / CGMCC3.15140) TaxID=1229662 RepID=W3WK86_PESFW|nr:uncharacterized protein PFICI_14523 [Pestalotiopsis fici W106-1]ETS73577.1 hypothetical protein PFICI_14523 [Pestalotiopsis fici W106-1]